MYYFLFDKPSPLTLEKCRPDCDFHFESNFVGVLPNITVELWEESNRVTDITTQLEANITGLPFGRDPFVTQYAVIVANNHTFNQTPPVYPGTRIKVIGQQAEGRQAENKITIPTSRQLTLLCNI